MRLRVRLAARFRNVDWALVAAAAILTLFSVVLLTTAGESTGARALATRQGVFFVVALILLLVLGRVHYSVFRSVAGPFYCIVLALLLLSLLQGRPIRGAAAWIVVGGTQVQPAEFMKVGLVLVLARIISGNRGRHLSGRRLVAALAAISIPSVLILRQPDVGTTGLLVGASVALLLLAGMSRRQLLLLGGGAVLLCVLAWQFLLVPYQKERLLVFLDPGRDPSGTGYAVIQARTAFGSGGLTGRGLGWGPQSRLNFLPEAHTDFIFARIGEELGLVGVVLTLGLFGLLFTRIIRAARRTSDAFGRALATGAALTFLVGLIVNAGMNVGLLPVTGVPLPFISYGGSSLLASYLLLGMALSVVVHGERWEEPEQSELFETHPG